LKIHINNNNIIIKINSIFIINSIKISTSYYIMLSQNDKNTLLKIMIFYSLLSYFIFPVIGYKLMKSKTGITNGLVVGSIISTALWYKYGTKKIKLA